MGMKVFISSTFKDLILYRKETLDVVLRFRCEPLAMEHFGAQPEEPKEVCKKEIRECDVFIGIYAHRYGFTPDGEEKSITQLEYEFAKKLKKDCLCFIVDKNYSWPVPFIEMDKYPMLEAFLGKVKKGNVVESFKSTEDFTKKLAASLGNLITKRKGTNVQKESIITPFAPTPYIPHPYPLPDHFSGRDSERAALSNWFFNETEPILVIEAIGGMGKSALSWVWLQQDMLKRSLELDGVFWWCFYDEPFDSFIQHLACYVMVNEDRQRINLSKLVAVLHNRRFLLVLDGLERALRGYSGMEAMFIQEKKFEGKPEEKRERDRRLREPMHPEAGRFLEFLSVVNTKTLITTRLMPTPLEGLQGVKHIFLEGLSPVDAVHFIRSEGIRGNRAELERAGDIYDYHPLMLKLLTSYIKLSRAKDIKDAFRLNLIDRKEPQKVLTKSFKLLSKKEQQVASCAAVFRSVFTFDSAKALFPKIDEDDLWQAMQELRRLGFLSSNEQEDRFDFHPIMRSFLYNNLTNRTKVHTLAVQYFQALPPKTKIITLDDMAPVIELYHHLVKAGMFDEARKLYHDRISEPAYYQLSAYHLIIELLKELFPEGEEQLPHLKNESDQAWALNSLANSYSLSGQPAKSISLYLSQVKLREKNNAKESIAIGLGNVADDQLKICQISASTAHLRKENLIGKEIGNTMETESSHRGLGRVMAFQGRTNFTKGLNPPVVDSTIAENELYISTYYCEDEEDYQEISLDYAYRSFSAILQAQLAVVLTGAEKSSASHNLEALEQARKALVFAERDAETDYPMPRDFVQAYWLLGEALIQCWLSSASTPIKPFDIHFYDEYFQEQVESLVLRKGDELVAAERCLNEALHRCRKVNLVELEPDILLTLARLKYANKKHLPSLEKILKEAIEISVRSGYRLNLADLHLFCGQVLLESKGTKTLLDLNANEHLQKAKEYALDVSEFKHLYQSDDPHFYDNIPEYEMLKRGMTEEERIRNGYWVAYKIAEELERRVSS